MGVSRVTGSVRFDTGIASTAVATGAVGQTIGGVQRTIMPGSVAVARSTEQLFATKTMRKNVMEKLAQAGNAAWLRTGKGFEAALKRTISGLRREGDPRAVSARAELVKLADDAAFLAKCRAAAIEKNCGMEDYGSDD